MVLSLLMYLTLFPLSLSCLRSSFRLGLSGVAMTPPPMPPPGSVHQDLAGFLHPQTSNTFFTVGMIFRFRCVVKTETACTLSRYKNSYSYRLATQGRVIIYDTDLLIKIL